MSLAATAPMSQDGLCVQLVAVILHQDPPRQVALTHSGNVLLFDQYKVTPPYTDSTLWWMRAGHPGFFLAPWAKGAATQARGQFLTLGDQGGGGAPLSQERGLWTLK